MSRNKPGQTILLANLKPHPEQTTLIGDITEAELHELMANMEAQGLHHAVEVLPDGTIVCGHQRVRSPVALGWAEIDVVVRHDLAKAGNEAVVAHLIQDNLLRRQISMSMALVVAGLPQKLQAGIATRIAQGEAPRDVVLGAMSLTPKENNCLFGHYRRFTHALSRSLELLNGRAAEVAGCVLPADEAVDLLQRARGLIGDLLDAELACGDEDDDGAELSGLADKLSGN